jgi:putative tricarboxylic transport membrane protein
MYGGSTTSILLNIPGEAASVATCLDGYKMARQGRAGAALGMSAIGSFVAGSIAVLGVSLLAPPLAAFALKFGPREYFALILLGLMMAVYLSEGSALKGLVMAATGLLLGTVGLDPVHGAERFTFGLPKLTDGLDFVVVAMGLFGIAEVLSNVEAPEARDVFRTALRKLLPTLEDWRRCWASLARGSALGFFIGVLPGGGAVISSFMAYAVEKRVSRHPERFGHGAVEGVAGPESANNAATSGAFVPMLALGLPSGAIPAIMMAAMMIHGIAPGPLLIQQQPQLFWGFIASMYVGNLVLLVLNLPFVGLFVNILRIPYAFLYPSILAFATLGVYAVNNSVVDVWIMAGMGLLGYVLRKLEFELAPIVLGLVLAPMLELSFRQSLAMSAGSYAIFVGRPIASVMLLVGLVLLLLGLRPTFARTAGWRTAIGLGARR